MSSMGRMLSTRGKRVAARAWGGLAQVLQLYGSGTRLNVRALLRDAAGAQVTRSTLGEACVQTAGRAKSGAGAASTPRERARVGELLHIDGSRSVVSLARHARDLMRWWMTPPSDCCMPAWWRRARRP